MGVLEPCQTGGKTKTDITDKIERVFILIKRS